MHEVTADPHVLPDGTRRWAKYALGLVAGTLAYNVIEAVVALWAGAVAESVALLGFGLDSLIEMAAAALLLWSALPRRSSREHGPQRRDRHCRRVGEGERRKTAWCPERVSARPQ